MYGAASNKQHTSFMYMLQVQYVVLGWSSCNLIIILYMFGLFIIFSLLATCSFPSCTSHKWLKQNGLLALNTWKCLIRAWASAQI
jgi:hypothetical protein